MLDVMMLTELAWALVIVRAFSVQQAMFYLGGTVVAVAAAHPLSDWVTKTLSMPGNPAFVWISEHIADSTQRVSLAMTVMPPEATLSTDSAHTTWIALHVLHGLLLSAMTIGLFVVFAIIAELVKALYDDRDLVMDRWQQIFTIAAGAICGTVLAMQTAFALANVAWLRVSSSLSVALEHSMFMQGIAVLSAWYSHVF